MFNSKYNFAFPKGWLYFRFSPLGGSFINHRCECGWGNYPKFLVQGKSVRRRWESSSRMFYFAPMVGKKFSGNFCLSPLLGSRNWWLLEEQEVPIDHIKTKCTLMGFFPFSFFFNGVWTLSLGFIQAGPRALWHLECKSPSHALIITTGRQLGLKYRFFHNKAKLWRHKKKKKVWLWFIYISLLLWGGC